MPLKTSRVGVARKREYRLRNYYPENIGPFNFYSDNYNGTWLSTRNGSGLKDHRKIIARGDCATTDFTGEFFSYTERAARYHALVREKPDYGTQHTETEVYIGRQIMDLQQPVVHLPTSTSSADNKALIQARAAVKSSQQHMSGFTFLGELKETLGMLKRPANALIQSVSKYQATLSKRKRGIRRGTSEAKRKALVDAAAGSWLEASFGWKPLLNDVKDIAETLARWNTENTRHTMVRGYGKDEAYDMKEYHAENMAGILMCTERRVIKTTRTVVYRCHIRAKDSAPPTGSLGRLAELAGFRAEDFIPSIYQLIPYSFLVDYFLNLGDVIEAACTSVADVNWVNRSEVIETVESTEIITPWVRLPGNQWRLEGYSFPLDNGMSRRRRKSVYRTKQDTIGLPSLEFSIPGGHSTKWTNMIALAAAKDRSLLRF